VLATRRLVSCDPAGSPPKPCFCYCFCGKINFVFLSFCLSASLSLSLSLSLSSSIPLVSCLAILSLRSLHWISSLSVNSATESCGSINAGMYHTQFKLLHWPGIFSTPPSPLKKYIFTYTKPIQRVFGNWLKGSSSADPQTKFVRGDRTRLRTCITSLRDIRLYDSHESEW